MKIGDRVKWADSVLPYLQAVEATREDRGTVQEVSEVDALVRWDSGQEEWYRRKNLQVVEPPTKTVPMFVAPTEPDKALRDIENCRALRDNKGKGEHDYILTYRGGVEAAFSMGHVFERTLRALNDWYSRGGGDTHDMLDSLLGDCSEHDIDLIEELTRTNTHAARVREDGTRKYPQGNYLKPGNVRQYCQSAIRHAMALERGEDRDADGFYHCGNFIFNILRLVHGQLTGIDQDDRIRP